ncbi:MULTISPECIES: thioredoxin family protein [unclassified Enterococcus]|uniref:thioredoxin family protein n=1 Tax=unclassified Enterococcus TaxID=2608891 RepID=UPI0013EB0F42|nr:MULTISPECIES: thioredoxin family protein [unclassified Enterococcus]
MKKTTDLAQVQTRLQKEETAVVYLSMPGCSVCHAVRPRIEELLTHYDLPAFHLDADETPEVASAFEVLTAPVVLIYHHGKEVARQARFIDFNKIKQLLDQLTAEEDSLSYEELFSGK